MKRTPIIVAAAGVALVGAWALFRPELLFVNKTVNESFPVAAVSTVATPQSNSTAAELTGQFHAGAHDTKGTATIYKLENGQRVLRLTNFMTSNGPDVRVLLVAASDVSDNDTVKNSNPIELGKLKGNEGDQNYDIPTGVDLAKYRAVTIWCNRFSVNFGTAPLGDGTTTPSAQAASPVRSGAFHGVAHDTKGTAAIYQLTNGQRVLRLTNFMTSNGPDVRVLLVAASDAADSDTVKTAGSIELGKLKGNEGDQNYDVPANVDLAKYRAVTIWCNRFGVNFATAPLGESAPQM